jgi:hypothetical protein
MASNILATESLQTVGASVRAVALFGRTLLNEVIRFGFCTGGGFAISLITLILAFSVFGVTDPTPPPNPLPF